MDNQEWQRFLVYMDNDVRRKCKPQRESLQGGPFAWLQTLSGKVFGDKVGPMIIRFFLEDELEDRENVEHDFIFRGRKIELKTGTEHSRAGVFLFEQIRPLQDWDIVLCVGLSVQSVVFFVLNRPFIENGINAWRNSDESIITPQHGGAKKRDRKNSNPDTFWIWTTPD